MSTADPIKDPDDVKFIYKRLRRWGKYREAELVVFGCNVAMRISDILQLKFSDVKEAVDRGNTITYIEFVEGKTKKNRRVTLNEAARGAVENLRTLFPDTVYLFQSNRIYSHPAPVSRVWISRCLMEVAESLELDYKLNTHSLRKTFGYHAYQSGVDINVLQKLFNHSSVRVTMGYIGITDERVQDVYQMINIGL